MRTLDRRTVILGEYIVEHGSTVRDAAKSFGISKSTIVFHMGLLAVVDLL
jgi:transposase